MFFSLRSWGPKGFLLSRFFWGRDPKNKQRKTVSTPTRKKNARGVDQGPDVPPLFDQGIGGLWFQICEGLAVSCGFCHRFGCVFFWVKKILRLWTSKGCKKKSTAVNLLQLPLEKKNDPYFTLRFFLFQVFVANIIDKLCREVLQ